MPTGVFDLEPNSDTEPKLWKKWCDNNCMEVVRELAFKYANLGEAGFRHLVGFGQRPEIDEWQESWYLAEKALYRICQVAHHDDFPRRKAASHCGGIAPYPPWQDGFDVTPMLADPGNAVYSAVVERLLEECGEWRHCDFGSTSKKCITDQLSSLAQLGGEKRGDCIEAALAAADYAWKMYHGQPWTYKYLKGGAFAVGELPPSLSLGKRCPPPRAPPLVYFLEIDGRVFPVPLTASFGPRPAVYVYPLGPYTRRMEPAHVGLG